MTEVAAPRAALGSLSVNNAQNIAPSSSNRLSLGAKRSLARPSMSARRSSVHSSALPSSTTTAGRPSMSGRRSSTHSRPSSIHGSTSSSVRSDPRPLHDKAYLKEQIAKIILYCMAHNYDRPLSPKLLLSPSSKDFKHLMHFFLTQIDPNFQFSSAVEDDIKKTMKLLGYPFNLSKNALQAAGTPHTWPALLLMMAWMVDFLNYDEKVEREDETGGAAAGDGEVSTPHPEKMFFAYLTRSYSHFINGDDEGSNKLLDELANTFAVRHQAAGEEIKKLEEERSRLVKELEGYRAASEGVVTLGKKKEEYASDVGKFEQLITDVTAHLKAMESKLEERKADWAEKREQEERLKEEQQSIAATLAAQEFTPLQIQSMLHQQSMLQSALSELESQKSKVQNERWEVERSVDRKINDLTQLVSEFNALGVSIEMMPSTAKYAQGLNLQLSMLVDASTVLSDEGTLTDVTQVVQPDLKVVVKPVLVGLHSQLQGRVAGLNASSRAQHEEWVMRTEQRAERQRGLEAMQVQLAKREEQLKGMRLEMNEQLRELVDRVEQVEGKVNEERGRRVREEREQAERVLAEVEAEKGRKEAEWKAEKQREQAELWQAIEELVNHAERIHATLTHISQQASHIRQTMAKTNLP